MYRTPINQSPKCRLIKNEQKYQTNLTKHFQMSNKHTEKVLNFISHHKNAKEDHNMLPLQKNHDKLKKTQVLVKI